MKFSPQWLTAVAHDSHRRRMAAMGARAGPAAGRSTDHGIEPRRRFGSVPVGKVAKDRRLAWAFTRQVEFYRLTYCFNDSGKL